MASSLLSDTAEQALRKLEECQGFHDDLVTVVEDRWRQFEGILEKNSDAAQWMSQLHPPYLNHIVETTVAGLLEDRIQFKVTPSPRFYNPGEFQSAQQGAKAHEILFRAQLKNDRFNEFQRPYVLDAAVVGLGVAKTFWRNEVGPGKRLSEVYRGGIVPELVEQDYVKVIFDGPVTEAIDLRDMYWHEAAVSAEKAQWMGQALWFSWDDLFKLAKRGVYEMDAVMALKPDAGSSNDQLSSLERERENRGRNKDMIEALEIYDRATRQYLTVGARKVELRKSKPWPFWHGEYPYTFTSLQPFPRSLRGMSIVEKLAHLQDMTWDLMNQRIDTTRFMLNFIQIIRADVDDPNAFPFEPGAQWFMEDPTAVTQWSPNPAAAQLSLPAESMLKSDMQNLAGGQPFTSTGEANQVGANTATEAALVTNLAQMAVKQMKTQVFYSYERIGCQRMYLNQQFIREPVFVETIGLDSEQEIKTILPFILQGEYRFDIAPMAESLNRSEKRAEANARWQVVTATAAVAAASGSPFNLRPFQEDWLTSFDIEDPDRYLAAPQAAQGPPGGQPNPAAAAAPAAAVNGVTAPQSIDPAVSPSAQASLSGAQFQQRNLALTGGVNNSG